jgi:molecular chaperone Hsp33
VTHHELISLPPENILQKLFSEEDLRLFSGRDIKANCTCTRENVEKMLKMLGEEEVQSIITEQGSVQINCDFCNKLYVFDENETLSLFHPEQKQTKH